ncbi:MAG TPA: ATP-binding protein [Steroidobacteraceae bacterium]
MSIRLQLLIVALTTLVLPWAGCQYARELETALRSSQEQSLLASAGTIANALSAQPQRVFHDAGDSLAFSAGAGDLYVYPLVTQPLLDGYREDWDINARPTPLPTTTGYRARLQAGSTERFLYLYLEVDDAHFDAQPNNVRPDKDRFDRVNLTLQGPDPLPGASPMPSASPLPAPDPLQAPEGRARYFFGTDAPGLIAAQSVVKGDDGADRVTTEPRIQAFWLQTSAGYHLEMRIPLSFVHRRLWIEAIDGRGNGRSGFSADASEGGRLFFATAGLDTLLETFIRDGTRATVIDANALKVGTAGNIVNRQSDADESEPIWYRYFMGVDTAGMPTIASSPDRLNGDSVKAALTGNPHAQWVLGGSRGELLLMAAAPILIEGQLHGAVVLEQAADQLLALRDRALTRLFNLTLIATASAVIIMFAFANWISVRIGRLRAAADSAVGSDGRIQLHMPESSSGDEIGALARGFERLLARLNEHTQYLRTLGGKLSHELRTPLTIVRSSLDNLESEGLRDDQLRYITRAREGTQRLQSILSALGAAARVEESIKQSERVNFDLRDLAVSAVAAYRDSFKATRFAVELPENPCFARGAPDLMVQLLDKLIENAVDFCPPDGTITVRLERVQSNYALQVTNDGPLIPQALMGRLFESLFEQREGRDDRPHFGLGLYIVRLIAEFHGGTAVAANREDGSGVIFTITLPLI